MSKRSLLTLGTLLAIVVIAGLAIFFAKGYTFSPRTGTIAGTGIISITSVPEGASVYLDGHLNTATNATIPSLTPKTYTVKIVKEGFIPWEKKVEVKEGLVSDLKVTLFPAIPTIYPLTFNGVANPVLSPDGQKLAFAVPMATVSAGVRQKGGIWVWNMVSQPISFVRGAEPHQLVAATNDLDFTKAVIRFSPDSKQILATLQEGGRAGEANVRNYLLNTDQSNQDLRDVTPNVAALLQGWDDDLQTKEAARVLAVKDPNYQKVASESAVVKWSPDETKFIVGTPVAQPTPTPSLKTAAAVAATNSAGIMPLSNVKVYDIEARKEYPLPAAKAYFWLPDSRHIILVDEGKVAIADFDGNNPAIVYAGKFEDSFAFPWPDSSRLVIITSFPTPTASQPNLYGINLK